MVSRILFGADNAVIQTRRWIAMGKRRMIERGRLKDEWRRRYFVEIDDLKKVFLGS